MPLPQSANGAEALHTGPPRLTQPHNAIAKRGRQPASGLRRGYIFGVSPTNTQPTACSVIIDNQPPISGFTLPAGQGPILPYGTTTYQNQPFNGPWLVNQTTMQGGTSVLVDIDTLSVVQILHGPSGNDYATGCGALGYVPSTGETLVGTHLHTGGYDSDGHTMPALIGHSQCNAMPSAIASAGPTIIAGSVPPPSSATGSLNTLAVTLTQSDFGSLPDWLASVILRVRATLASDWRQEIQLDPSLMTYSLGTGTITSKQITVGVGGTVDVGVAYKDFTGAVSATTWYSALSTVSDPNGALLGAGGALTYARLPPAVSSVITAGGALAAGTVVTGSIASGAVQAQDIDGATGSGAVSEDNIPDGSTYARVKGTELSTGFVKQLNDGTNVRTAAQVAGALDTSSRIIGPVYDGTTALTPADITNAITNAGLVKVANATGQLPSGSMPNPNTNCMTYYAGEAPYGVSPSNSGTANDTALQACITAATAAGMAARIILPSGILPFTNGVTLTGVSGGATLIIEGQGWWTQLQMSSSVGAGNMFTVNNWGSSGGGPVKEGGLEFKNFEVYYKNILPTTVAASPTPTTTSCGVASAAGMAINETIEIDGQTTVVTGVSGSTVTFFPALSAPPVSGDAVVTSGSGCAIQLNASHFCTVENVRFQNCPFGITDDTNGFKNGTLNCTWFFTNIVDAVGAYFAGTNDFMDNCSVIGAGQPAIQTGCTGVIVNGCTGFRASNVTIEQMWTGLTVGGVTSNGTTEHSQFSNLIIRCRNQGIVIQPPSGGGSIYGTEFVNVICDGGNGNTTSFNSMIYIGSNGLANSKLQGVTFLGGTVWRSGGAGLEVNSGEDINIIGTKFGSNGQNASCPSAQQTALYFTGGAQGITVDAAILSPQFGNSTPVSAYAVSVTAGALSAGFSGLNIVRSDMTGGYAGSPVTIPAVSSGNPYIILKDNPGYNDQGTIVTSSAAGPGTITFVQSAQGTAGSVTMGAAPTAGDLLIAFSFKHSGSQSPGTGWTQLLTNTSGSPSMKTFWKIAGASESTTQSPTTAGTNNISIYEFSSSSGSWIGGATPTFETSVVLATSASPPAVTGSLTGAQLSTLGAACCIVAATYDDSTSGTNTPPANFSTSMSGILNLTGGDTNGKGIAGYKLAAGASTYSQTATWSGSGNTGTAGIMLIAFAAQGSASSDTAAGNGFFTPTQVMFDNSGTSLGVTIGSFVLNAASGVYQIPYPTTPVQFSATPASFSWTVV